MEKLDLDFDVGSSPGDMKQANQQEAREISTQRCIQSLVHACQCRDADCRLPSCLKMKRVFQHTTICKRKTKGGCPICKNLVALCCYHGKRCQETKCSISFCSSIKQKLKQLQVQQRVQQAKLLRRRMVAMNTRPGASSPPPSKPGEHALPHNAQKALQQANPQDARELSIQRCIQSLVHACQCRDAKCRLSWCLMKRVFQHTMICMRKTKGDCPICNQLIELCCYHACSK